MEEFREDRNGTRSAPPPSSDAPEGSGGSPVREEIDLGRFDGVSAVVILPTLNERSGLARTLGDLPSEQFHRVDRRVQPLIIDGGSTDGTLDVAREWDIPVLRQASQGKGGAMIEAITWVHRQRIPYVIVLDADATYPPDRILPTLELLARGTDLVVGVRHPVWGGPSDAKDLVHRLGNLALSYSASVLSRRPILDLCSGFWGVSTERFMDLGLSDATFAIEAELVLKAIQRGYSFHQIPIEYRERLGVAKLRAFRDGRRILRTIVREARPGPRRTGSVGQTGTWARDVLSIGLSLGGSGPTLDVSPSEAVEAGRVLAFLRQPATTGQTPRPTNRRFSAPPSTAFARTAARDSTEPRLALTLPPPPAEPAGVRRATVSIKSARRELVVELPLGPRSETGNPSGDAWSRSGGWMKGRGAALRARASSLLVLTSRLDFRPDHQHETLLAANGFHVVDSGRASEGSPGRSAPSAAGPERR
jgi:Glycosyl transferase family 2